MSQANIEGSARTFFALIVVNAPRLGQPPQKRLIYIEEGMARAMGRRATDGARESL